MLSKIKPDVWSRDPDLGSDFHLRSRHPLVKVVRVKPFFQLSESTCSEVSKTPKIITIRSLFKKLWKIMCRTFMMQNDVLLQYHACIHHRKCTSDPSASFFIMKVSYIIFHNFLNNEPIIIIFGVLETSDQVLWDSWKKYLTRATLPSGCLERRWKSDPKSESRDQTFWWNIGFSCWNNSHSWIMILNYKISFY